MIESSSAGSGAGTGPSGTTRPPMRAIWLLAAAIAAIYSALAVFNHYMLRTTGFDLGIFDQAVRSYAGLNAPTSDLKGPGFALLGDHFHPILALLTPLYWIAPSAVTLLIAQALLFAGSVVPVTRFATERLGNRTGLLIGGAYGLSWGIQHAVWFDFHEIAFAVPLLAFSMIALARRQWLAGAAWALPLLLVKEDLSITVLAIGVYIFFFGQRWIGAGLTAIAAAAGLLIFFVAIPAVNPDGVYPYFSISMTETDPMNPFERFFLPGTKWVTVLLLLLPTVFLAVRSPIALLIVPTLVWRFWATNPAYWGTDFHYSAVLMPILFVAMVDGLSRTGSPLPAWVPRVANTRPVVAGVACGIAVVSIGVVAYDRRDYIKDWRPVSEARAEHAVLDLIPDGATVSAANTIAPQLTDRSTVYLFPNQTEPSEHPVAEWVVVSTMHSWPLSADEYAEEKSKLPAKGYALVAEAGGVDLYRRQ